MIKERAILSTFAVDPGGNIGYTTNPNKMWDDRVVSVLGTMTGSRLHRPSFGVSSSQMPFDSREEIRESAATSVANAFTMWLPYLTLLSADVSEEGDEDVITVRYALPNLDVVTTQVNAGMLSLNGSDPLTEDLS